MEDIIEYGKKLELLGNLLQNKNTKLSELVKISNSIGLELNFNLTEINNEKSESFNIHNLICSVLFDFQGYLLTNYKADIINVVTIQESLRAFFKSRDIEVEAGLSCIINDWKKEIEIKHLQLTRGKTNGSESGNEEHF